MDWHVCTLFLRYSNCHSYIPQLPSKSLYQTFANLKQFFNIFNAKYLFISYFYSFQGGLVGLVDYPDDDEEDDDEEDKEETLPISKKARLGS